jgi:Uma2 family endonuclease
MMSVTAETVDVTIANAPVLPVPVGRLSVEKYHEMIRQGILTENDRFELLDGILVRKMTINPPHRLATQLTREVLDGILPEGWHIQTQSPTTLVTSEPEPDGMVVRGRLRDYGDRHPSPSDVALIIEVADATLQFDRTFKKALYAQAGIAVYWIVNLVDRRIEVYTEPTGAVERPTYANRRDHGPLDEIPVFIEGRDVGRIPVADLLP